MKSTATTKHHWKYNIITLLFSPSQQNIRGLGNKTNELYCHLRHDFPHILCIAEHHLRESELQLTQLANYSLGASYCRKTFLKGGVSIFVYRNLKYNSINIDEFNIDKDIEACAIHCLTENITMC